MFSLLNNSVRFGVELEGFSPVGTVGVRAGRSFLSSEGLAGWVAKEDGSMSIGDGTTTRNVEFNSPVLNGSEGMDNVYRVASLLQDAGYTANSTCGVHVHIEGGTLTLTALKALVLKFAKSSEYWEVLGGRSFTWYCKNLPLTAAFFEDVKAAKTVAELVRVVNVDRYCAVNLTRLTDSNVPAHAKTVEFRFCCGTFSPEKVCMLVCMLVALVEQAKSTKPGTMKADSYTREMFMKHLNWPGWCVLDVRCRSMVSGTLKRGLEGVR